MSGYDCGVLKLITLNRRSTVAERVSQVGVLTTQYVMSNDIVNGSRNTILVQPNRTI